MKTQMSLRPFYFGAFQDACTAANDWFTAQGDMDCVFTISHKPNHGWFVLVNDCDSVTRGFVRLAD